MTGRGTSSVNDTKCRGRVERTSSPERPSTGELAVRCLSTRAQSVVAVGLTVKPVGKPDAGNPHVRFDERGRETGHFATAPVLDFLQIKGKKRHLTVVDTEGLLLCAIIHAADMQDRDGGALLMSTMFGLFPFLLKLYADSGYQGPKFRQGLQRVCRQINVEIVKRTDVGKFVVLPRRWVVERTIAWLNRCRCLAKDWECLNRNGLAFLRWASVRLMIRKLCQETR